MDSIVKTQLVIGEYISVVVIRGLVCCLGYMYAKEDVAKVSVAYCLLPTTYCLII